MAGEEFLKRIYKRPKRLSTSAEFLSTKVKDSLVLAMLLENLGIDKAVQLGKLEDWKAAVAELEFKEHS